ncbi:MAG: serine hydrolase [Bacteroidota bacterium]
MNQLYLSCTFLLLAIFPSSAQDNQAQAPSINIDSMARVIQATYEVPGLAMVILRNEHIYYSGALGLQSIDTQSPLTPSSLFHMASVSKPFVATAILQLVEAGKLKLDDKLVDHLPYFKMKDDRFRKITIKQMLNHSSGIPDVEDYEWDKPQYDDGAAERYSKSFTQDSLDFSPGEEFSYSNAAFDILADVIAKVSGMTFETYMTKHIFQPTGMQHSTFFKPDVPKEIATQPHGVDDNVQMTVLDVYPYNRKHAPSSTLHSNMEGMTQWARLYFNKGTIHGNRVFSEATYDLLTSPTMSVNEKREICLGWFTVELDNKRFYYHSGGDDGYRTFFGFIPDEKAAIILMANSEQFSTGDVATYLASQLFGNQKITWKKPIHFPLKKLILSQGIDSCKAFYYHVQKHQEDQYSLNGGHLDDLGYWLLDRGKHQQALDIFLFNVELNPEDAGWHDSVGDAYAAMKNTPKAIEWYEKALAINPEQDFTIKKLKKLKK